MPVNGVDQRGIVRPQGAVCDIGAFEQAAGAPAATNIVPTITSNGGGLAATVNAAENQTAVTTVTAYDAIPARHTVYPQRKRGWGEVQLDAATGVLSFIVAPDFEGPTDLGTNNTYRVTVLVTDSGTPAGQTYQVITVTVTNVNEFAPVISSKWRWGNCGSNACPKCRRQ